MVETKSLAGSDHHTPSTPKDFGSNISNGKRNISCRDNDRKMLIFAFPIDWKKLVITA